MHNYKEKPKGKLYKSEILEFLKMRRIKHELKLEKVTKQTVKTGPCLTKDWACTQCPDSTKY